MEQIIDYLVYLHFISGFVSYILYVLLRAFLPNDLYEYCIDNKGKVKNKLSFTVMGLISTTICGYGYTLGFLMRVIAPLLGRVVFDLIELSSKDIVLYDSSKSIVKVETNNEN